MMAMIMMRGVKWQIDDDGVIVVDSRKLQLIDYSITTHAPHNLPNLILRQEYEMIRLNPYSSQLTLWGLSIVNN